MGGWGREASSGFPEGIAERKARAKAKATAGSSAALRMTNCLGIGEEDNGKSSDSLAFVVSHPRRNERV
jgi:hypothetical protein